MPVWTAGASVSTENLEARAARMQLLRVEALAAAAPVPEAYEASVTIP